ncbi:MAG: polysaccharide biosynthesis tyrosine autokinase [Prosthecobacter sp.]|nr:polysaccharide biosynthesis tyrosine autokinase [Prosthecobacter sp.]
MRDTGNELQQQALDSWQVIRNRFGLIVLSFLLVFATAAIITYIMPRKYRGLVEMKIERMQNKVQVFQHSTDDFMAPSDVVIKNEFESITKPETLYPVVDKLELEKRWSLPNRQSALAKLRGNLDTQSSVRSDFVTITFYDQDPAMAAEIANAVSQSYMTRRVEVESKQKQEALDMLGKQIAEQEQLRDQARLKMQEARKKGGIVGEWFSNGSNSTTPGANLRTTEDNMVMTREQALLQADLEVQSLSAEIDQLSKLDGDQLVARASGLKLENANVTGMLGELNSKQVAREGLVNAGRGRNHPDVLGVDSEIALQKKLILEAVEAHLAALQTRLDSAIKRRDVLKSSNEDAKKELLDQGSAQNEYKTAADDVAYIENLLLQLKSSYFETKAGLELVKSPATIYAVATPEAKPAKPNVALNLALGGALGLMLGFGLAFFLEYMDTSVKSLDDVERFLGVPVLAVIPKDVAVLHRTSGFNPDAEAYRILRTNIEFNRRNPDANCITVTSGGAGEGKSTTLCNLAYVCAQGGYSVLLIDADLRRPRMHTLFDVSNAVGLTNFLTTNVQLEEVVVRTPVENLYFLPSGMLPADSAGVLNSQRMTDLIAEAKSRFDLVLIDSPPILGVSDASVLSNEADLTLIVVQHRKLPRHMLMRVKQTVENVGGTVLGVVLNNVDLRSDSQYQYYTSYYTYYSPNNTAAPAGNKPEKRKKQAAAGHVAHTNAVPSNTPRGDLF